MFRLESEPAYYKPLLTIFFLSTPPSFFQQTDPPVDPDAHGEHDPIQRQEASLEENEAQALNAFFRDVECARFQEPFSRGTSVLLFSHGDFSQ